MHELDGMDNKHFNSDDSEDDCDCGNGSCDDCNPDGNTCDNSYCDYCDYCHLESDDTDNYKVKKASGPVVLAQAKLVKSSDACTTVHIQYKQSVMPTGCKYFTKNIEVHRNELSELYSVTKNLIATNSSLSGSGVPYYRLRHSGNTSYVVLGQLGVNGFYLKLIPENKQIAKFYY
jgi:hypothetical protein